MPKNVATTSKNEKAKASDRSPSRGASASTSTPTHNTNTIPTLQQLKQTIETTPGIIKNSADALHHLSSKQWLIPHQDVTCTQLAAILLSLVTANGQRNTSDKISENVSNVIKAVAFLLEEAVVTKYAETIANRLAGNPSMHTTLQTNAEMNNNLLETLETLNKSLQEQIGQVLTVTEKIHKNQNSPPDTITNAPYRDSLVNGAPNNSAYQPPPANITKAKLQNWVNIEACQILAEIQRADDPTGNDTVHLAPDSAGKIKAH